MNATTSPLRNTCMQHLIKLSESLEGMRMAVVSSTDGFPIAMLDVDPAGGRKASAMAAALDGLCKSIVKEFALGTLEGTVLECEQELVLCRQLRGSKRNLVLLVVVGEGVSYGHALWAIKNTAQEITLSLQKYLAMNVSTHPDVKEFTQ